jgi:futalosine hydrolase
MTAGPVAASSGQSAQSAQSAPPGLLVVCAVEEEADAVVGAWPAEPVTLGPLAGRRLSTGAGPVDVLTAAVGPAAVAAATAYALGAAGGHYLATFSMGVAGAFKDGGAIVGGVAVADTILFADLGVLAPDGFQDLATLGFGLGLDLVQPPAAVVDAIAARCRAAGLPTAVGPVLTLATFTGTDARAAELTSRYAAVAEAMEGAGIATATATYGLPTFEVRTISNWVGDRDREVWELDAALSALRSAAAGVFAEPLPLAVT